MGLATEARNLAAAKRVWKSFSDKSFERGQLPPEREKVIQLVLAAIGQPCPYCGTRLTPKQLSIDHVTPIERGGTSHILNLMVVCKRCNRRKGALTAEEMRALLDLLNKMAKEARRYVLTKLSSVPFRWWRST